MIQLGNDPLDHDLGEIIEIYDHAGLGIHLPLDGHKELVAVPMKIAAFPWVVVDEVGGFKPVFFAEDHGCLCLPMLNSRFSILDFEILDVHPVGLEPTTCGLEGRCSVHLSYGCPENPILSGFVV